MSVWTTGCGAAGPKPGAEMAGGVGSGEASAVRSSFLRGPATRGSVLACGLLAGLAALSAPSLSAQAIPDSGRVEVVGRLQPGASVRFTARGERGSGWVEEVGARGLLIRLDGGGEPARLDPARLDSLWVRTDAAGAGAAVGAVVGLVPVVATCGQELDECGLVPNGVLLVAASAAAGWLVGRRIDTWRLLLP